MVQGVGPCGSRFRPVVQGLGTCGSACRPVAQGLGCGSGSRLGQRFWLMVQGLSLCGDMDPGWGGGKSSGGTTTTDYTSVDGFQLLTKMLRLALLDHVLGLPMSGEHYSL